jgi:hypothetical protein
MIKRAREEAKKEIDEYSNKMSNELNEDKKKIDSTKVSMEDMEKRLQKDTTELKVSFNNNKEQVISFLMENLFHVDLSVPDVVRGKFSEKLKN